MFHKRYALFTGIIMTSLLGLFLFVSACGDDKEEVNPDPNEGKTVTQMITAAAGGTIATANGSAKLAVPASALAVDTELTLAVEAAASGSLTSVYNFGPDGTQFSKPATLSINYTGATDKKVALAVLEDGKWQPIEGSTLAGGVVSGAVSHFSKFTIIIVEDGKTITCEIEGDTCLMDIESACWAPAGACTIKMDGSVRWADDSSFTMDTETMKGTATNGNGEVCYTMSISETSNTMHYGDKDYIFEGQSDGAMKLTCPDGTVENYTKAQTSTLGSCGGQSDTSTCTLEGACTEDPDCAPLKCCDVGGMKMCMEECPEDPTCDTKADCGDKDCCDVGEGVKMCMEQCSA